MLVIGYRTGDRVFFPPPWACTNDVTVRHIRQTKICKCFIMK